MVRWSKAVEQPAKCSLNDCAVPDHSAVSASHVLLTCANVRNISLPSHGACWTLCRSLPAHNVGQWRLLGRAGQKICPSETLPLSRGDIPRIATTDSIN